MPQQKNLILLLILDNYYPYIGGAETLFQKVAEGLVSKGHKVIVITSMWKDSMSYEIFNGVEIHRIQANRYLLPFKSFSKMKECAKGADLILTSTYAMAPFAKRVASKTKIPCVIVVHEVLNKIWFDSMPFFRATFHWLAEKIILKFIHYQHYIAVSDFTYKQLVSSGLNPNGISKIYNAFDELPKHIGPSKKDEKKIFNLFFAGRPGASKGAFELVEAIANLIAKKYDIHLTMALGLDPVHSRQQIIKLIKKHNLSEKVNILEPLSFEDLSRYAQSADACIVPSKQEGFGILAAQFSCLDNVLIVSKKGALPETVGGKIVWIEDINGESIADSIEKAYKGDFLDLPLKKFEWDEVINNYESTLSEVVK